MQTLTNAAADLSTAVASEPLASTEFPVTLVNVLPVSKAMEESVANRPKFERVANQISIVLTTPNVVQIELVDADKALSPTEPCASM